jgi:hypothetical protein
MNIPLNDLLVMIVPLLLLHFGLIGFALYNWFKYGCKNLSKPIWLVIILLVNTAGPIAFILFGRKQNDNSN